MKEQKQLENKDLWMKKEEERVPTLAELSLPKEELRRLRTLGIALDKKLKIGKAGITEGIVNGIHERWRRSEVVKLVCEDMCKMNMKRTHDLLEVRIHFTYFPSLILIFQYLIMVPKFDLKFCYFTFGSILS